MSRQNELDNLLNYHFFLGGTDNYLIENILHQKKANNQLVVCLLNQLSELSCRINTYLNFFSLQSVHLTDL